MYKKLILISLLVLTPLLFAGCSKRTVLTNDEIIAETKKCDEAGLKAVRVVTYSPLTGYVGTTRIECVPYE